ncbi:hypothetical protein MSAN_01920300 [Mycena sanguinolenta]|uniref:Uncharacterized protein n=1 Tax=Mycena sanguinolenta TaxID=230812 RepID=A0A8H6XQ21_9AGAR|nr:hypothetical protein MSAN_01920300 [Mycena sanguinolenta]
MSPSMPIDIASSSSSSTLSVASSPTSTSSSSSAGVYVPVHRRGPSASSTFTPAQPHLPIYTPAQLLHLAHSPFVKAQVNATRALLHALHPEEKEDNVLVQIAMSRKQMRAREHAHRNPVVPGTKAHHATSPAATAPSPVSRPTAASTAARRRPLPGRATDRAAFNTRRPGTPTASRNTNRFMDAAGWRPQAVVPAMQGRHVPALVV